MGFWRTSAHRRETRLSDRSVKWKPRPSPTLSDGISSWIRADPRPISRRGRMKTRKRLLIGLAGSVAPPKSSSKPSFVKRDTPDSEATQSSSHCWTVTRSAKTDRLLRIAAATHSVRSAVRLHCRACLSVFGHACKATRFPNGSSHYRSEGQRRSRRVVSHSRSWVV